MIRIGTRGSALARAQAAAVERRLHAVYPNLDVRVEIISTRGDRVTDTALHMLGGKGLFVKEIEEALLERRIDIAVHSMKDVPTEIHPDLMIGAVLERDDPRDALVAGETAAIKTLPEGARVGTSSLRRRAQLLSVRPDLSVPDIRGNVDTRLAKLAAGEYDALLVAACGLDRLGLTERISERIEPDTMLPAACQGIVGIEVRGEDDETRELVSRVGSERSFLAAEAERALLAGLGGGCHVPVGGLADIGDGRITLTGMVASADGRRIVRRMAVGSVCLPVVLGAELAKTILRDGGGELLARNAHE